MPIRANALVLAGLVLLGILAGCFSGNPDAAGELPRGQAPNHKPDNVTLSAYAGCVGTFPDGSLIPCEGHQNQSWSDDSLPSQARCVWKKTIGNQGHFVVVRDASGRYGLQFEIDPLYSWAVLEGEALVVTEQGTARRLFVSNGSSGAVDLGVVPGAHRSFSVRISEVQFQLWASVANLTSRDFTHGLERYPWTDWIWLVWTIDAPGGPYRFAQTREFTDFGEVSYGPGTFALAGLDFEILFEARQVFSGSAAYEAEPPGLLSGEEPASPLC